MLVVFIGVMDHLVYVDSRESLDLSGHPRARVCLVGTVHATCVLFEEGFEVETAHPHVLDVVAWSRGRNACSLA